MRYLPIFLNSQNAPCLVVGGGAVAQRKIQQLLRAEATVTVVAIACCTAVQKLADDGAITLLQRKYDPSDVANYRIVIAATDDAAANQGISEDAGRARVLVNVVDQPNLCSFIMPSVIDRDPVMVAVSTGGAAPVLARVLRARLETMIPSAYGQLAGLMARFRKQVRDKIPDPRLRHRFWETIVAGPSAEQLFAGRGKRALQLLEKQLEVDAAITAPEGEVYLVGGGPGDPDLLTFRALRLMQQADVVVYDRLVAPAIVDLCRRDAERIYVGKARDQHALTQHEINQLLIDRARQGQRVVRLKGGDPFIFGRGGEEIETLAAEAIPFQIVPGITAASGCAAYAGIPLTHRDYAQSCVFVTGHLKDGEIDLDWSSLARPGQTIAIYMGLHGLEKIATCLISHGLAADTPTAIIQQGTTSHQRVLVSPLGEMSALAATEKMQPPCMVIIGEVVRLREQLAWFD